MNVNEQIRILRENAGYTRRAFSDHFRIPLRTLEEWEAGRRTPPEYVVRMMSYQLQDECRCFETYRVPRKLYTDRNVSIIEDLKGKKIVVIHDIVFKGKRRINWKDVERYLERYVGEIYEITQYADEIYIGKDFPDEYAGSKDTERLQGTQAKANAAQGLPELIQIASEKGFKENKAEKHSKNAKYGWYRYRTRFALPIYNEEGEVERYNVFQVELIVRHDMDGKLYLYDIINIKKRNEHPV